MEVPDRLAQLQSDVRRAASFLADGVASIKVYRLLEAAVDRSEWRVTMPLKRGKSEKVISGNIDELAHSQTAIGRKRNASPTAHEQNVAIAMRKAGIPPKRKR